MQKVTKPPEEPERPVEMTTKKKGPKFNYQIGFFSLLIAILIYHANAVYSLAVGGAEPVTNILNTLIGLVYVILLSVLLYPLLLVLKRVLIKD